MVVPSRASWASKTCRKSRVSFTFVCKDLHRHLFFCDFKYYLNFYSFLYLCFTSLCNCIIICILRVEGWRKSPLLRCWKLAQASIADFSRPQNWIYWSTLSAVSFENRLMIGTMCFSCQRRKMRGYRPINLKHVH